MAEETRFTEPTLIEKLKTRQQLSLDQKDIPNLNACHSCPALEQLQIRTGICDRNRELQTALDANTLIHYMEQPKIKKLILCDIRITDEHEKKSYSYGPFENVNPLCHLPKLEPRQINIDADTLMRLFRKCSNLRSFTLTRPATNRGRILLDDLAFTLRTISHSLGNLTLGYHSGHKQPEITLLPHLRHLTGLKHLKVDPSMLLGRRLCAHWPYHPPTLAKHEVIVICPPISFADHLPNNLETLTLEIDVKQVMRMRNYRREIIQSIIEAKSRLVNLKEITLFEDVGTWAKVNYCSCGQCYHETAGVWRGNRRSADETEERRQFVRQLRKVGIKIFRDTADGHGRYECSAWGNV